MSFSAEPYGVFVDDLLSSLTGGVTREQFRFLVEKRPFRLGAGLEAMPETVRVHGLVDGEFHRFVNDQGQGDYTIVDGLISWRQDADGTPGDGAIWPDEGTLFWASYEKTYDPQNPPRLTDRNPGSIVRTLAESFSREFAVLSLQLDSVYEASFIDTAKGRDLEQLAALLGLSRRSQAFASGELVFSRATPAAADITIPEGARISTADAPAVTVEVIADATLRSGTLSVTVPVQALVEGAGGVAPANRLTVIHRPILGVDRVTNPDPVAFGDRETDLMLRRRMQRALQTSGRSTVAALVGAVTSVDGVREQDVLVEEDHLAFPGAVKLTVAADLTEDARNLAALRIEEFRPAGVRVLHDLELLDQGAIDPGPGGGGGGDAPAPGSEAPSEEDIAKNRYPVVVTAGVTPTSLNLTPADKEALVEKIRVAISDQVALPGLGEPLIYNQLVAAVMAIDGVYDVVIDLQPEGSTDPAQRFNLYPSPIITRVELAALDVTLRGARIALDVAASVTLLSFATDLDEAAAKAEAAIDIKERLISGLNTLVPGDGGAYTITQAELKGLLPKKTTYEVDAVSYTAEFVDEGLRVSKSNVTITPGPDQVVQIRRVVAN